MRLFLRPINKLVVIIKADTVFFDGKGMIRFNMKLNLIHEELS